MLCAILTVFNATFKLAIVSVQGENFIGICQTMGLVALQVFIQYQVLTRSVSMIHRVPQMVATLMNAGVRDLSGEDEGRNLIVAAAGSIRGGTSKAAASALSPKNKPDSDPKKPTTKPETDGSATSEVSAKV